jgi:tetratricopeptide (TPR) repeat protein
MGAFLPGVERSTHDAIHGRAFLYLPLIGWLFALALLIHRVPRWQLSAPLCAGALAAWALLAWNRSWIWRDDLTLFVQTSQQHPGIRRVEENAVAAIFKLPHVRGMFELDKSGRGLRVVSHVPSEQRPAIHETLTEANRLFPENENIASALGVLHAISGRPAEGLPFFKLAAQRRPNDPRLWTNLGQASMEANAWREAEEAINRALALAPDNIDALRTASRLAWQREDFQTAVVFLQKLQHLEPNQPEHARWLKEAQARLEPHSEQK